LLSNSFLNRCIRETLSGIRDGLSRFAGPSSSALIFSLKKEGPLFICDPQNLLKGYEPKLQALYSDDNDWCKPIDLSSPCSQSYNYIEPQANLQLDGLISHGGSSCPVYYQMWFTEHHPNICSLGPTECWLEHAVLRFSHDVANESSLYTGISGSFLREYATHAVRDSIIDKMESILGIDINLRIYPILDAVLGISKTNEEGAVPHGALIFVEPRTLDSISFLARFLTSELPSLHNFKHVRKLLQAVEYSGRTLVSDGKDVIGITENHPSNFHITADFQGKFGYLSIDNEVICSYQDGSYSANTHKAKLFEVEEALLDFEIEPSIRNDMFLIIAALVHNGEDKKFGCTFVIDLAEKATDIAGQDLTPAIDLRKPNNLELAAALSKVDGALLIRADLHLHAFACLLDGQRVKNEDRARGARFNSALRFTAQNLKTIVVVVSSDRPVSIFLQGKEMQGSYNSTESSKCDLYPIPLETWLQAVK
jgi:hypothetical protein